MRVEVYRDTAGAWRWRLRARNGRIVADGSEGYASRTNALRAVLRVVSAIRADAIGGVDSHA